MAVYFYLDNSIKKPDIFSRPDVKLATIGYMRLYLWIWIFDIQFTNSSGRDGDYFILYNVFIESNVHLTRKMKIIGIDDNHNV